MCIYCIKYLYFHKFKIIKIEIMKYWDNYNVMLSGWIKIKLIGKSFYLNITSIN
jgi:hypothetical protein